MQYKSTRNSNIRLSSAQAISRGISEEGGLFVPEHFPDLSGKLEELSRLNYMGRAEAILKLFLTDYSEEEIRDCVTGAYEPQKFENDTPAKLRSVKPGLSMLELWHGPTCAFKDMALQLLPHLLSKALQKEAADKEAVILVATSGDTGKAALEGFKDVPHTRIIVFYPESGVSAMQLRQMNTQEGNNLTVCGVEGNFDDCQTQVKVIFTDEKLKQHLAEKGMVFSSANSINWGRLLPQIVYYFSAYLDLYTAGKLASAYDKVNFVVPTGNFGNILAAYYAKRMGLPVGKLICASNSNNVLTEFIRSGTYQKDRQFYTTISPSMDILVSSNLERLLYHLCGEDSNKLTAWMASLSQSGSYTVDADTAEQVQELFYGSFCSDEETQKTIRQVFQKEHYLCDTHTAVAMKAYEDYIRETGDSRETVVVSTASPYKFAPSVLSAIGHVSSEDEFVVAKALSAMSGTEIPRPILELETKPQRFDNKVNKATIKDFVLQTIGGR